MTERWEKAVEWAEVALRTAGFQKVDHVVLNRFGHTEISGFHPEGPPYYKCILIWEKDYYHTGGSIMHKDKIPVGHPEWIYCEWASIRVDFLERYVADYPNDEIVLVYEVGDAWAKNTVEWYQFSSKQDFWHPQEKTDENLYDAPILVFHKWAYDPKAKKGDTLSDFMEVKR